jgi:hypothetical protein
MERLRDYSAAWIVIEAEVSELIKGVKWASNVNMKSIFRTWMSWTLKYPNVHWSCWPGQAWAENVTYRLLEKWYQAMVVAPAAQARRREREAWRLATTKPPDPAAAVAAPAGGAGRKRRRY